MRFALSVCKVLKNSFLNRKRRIIHNKMKAKVFEVEYESMNDFCYNHGGIRVHDSWYDENKETSRFLTQDRRHSDYDEYSYVYIAKSIGRLQGLEIIITGREATVATCVDEENDKCFIFCKNPRVGDIVEFDKEGFAPYTSNPIPNRWGRNEMYTEFVCFDDGEEVNPARPKGVKITREIQDTSYRAYAACTVYNRKVQAPIFSQHTRMQMLIESKFEYVCKDDCIFPTCPFYSKWAFMSLYQHMTDYDEWIVDAYQRMINTPNII